LKSGTVSFDRHPVNAGLPAQSAYIALHRSLESERYLKKYVEILKKKHIFSENVHGRIYAGNLSISQLLPVSQ
jgi:hypothetical protein